MKSPTLTPDEQAHSTAFNHWLRTQMQGQSWPFADFMHAALYANQYGYYRCGTQKFGKQGDFITAPELSPLFSRCLAVPIAKTLTSIPNANILEIGAGSGILAADLLLALEQQQLLPDHYVILELSAELQIRQAETLRLKAAHLLNRVQWLSQLPTAQSFQGVILANEVVDAMPVQLFYKDQQRQLQDCQVAWDTENNQWGWVLKPANSALQQAVETLEQRYGPLPPDYRSEINHWSQAWIHSLNQVLQKGLILVIDYGYAGAEYYHPQRTQGTLLCHYRHQVHANPLINLGVQDITASVDFTALAETALAAGLAIAGYTTQADFLLANGLLNELANTAQPDQPHQYLPWVQAVKTLILPNAMGERFKVLALSRQLALSSAQLGFNPDRRIILGLS